MAQQPTSDNGARILLVEDHPNVAMATVALLKSMGFRPTLASTVADANAAADREHFDLLLADYRLPDGTGVDVLRHVTQNDPMPAVLMTAYAKQYMTAAREAGFEQVLEKPVELATLRQAIETALQNGTKRP